MNVRPAALLPDTAVKLSGGACTACGWVFATRDGQREKTCERCGAYFRLTYTVGDYNGRQPCDDRCQYAIGPACSCNCGGENHRAGYIDVPMVPTWVRERDATRHQRKAEAAQRRAGAAAQAKRARREAFMDEYPVTAVLYDDDAWPDGDRTWEFFTSLRDQLDERCELSPRQVDALERAMTRERQRRERAAAQAKAAAAALAAGVRVPAGRHTLSGTVVSYKAETDYRFSYHGQTVHKWLVQTDDGYRLFGKIPAGFNPQGGEASGGLPDGVRGVSAADWDAWRAALPGRRVTFTATLEPSARDPLYGYYKQARRVDADAPVKAARAPRRAKTDTGAPRPADTQTDSSPAVAAPAGVCRTTPLVSAELRDAAAALADLWG